MSDYFGPNQVTKKSWAKSYGIVFALIITFFSGWFLGSGRTLGDRTSAADTQLRQKGLISSSYQGAPDFQLFWDVWDNIKSEYIHQPVSDSDLFYGAMRGLLSALDDPYSEFYDPELAEIFDQELSGSFSGIGVEVGIKKGQLVVIAPLDGSPGDLAGLRAGDHILSIDDVDTAFLSLDEAVSRIRGEEGTTVTLLVQNESDDPRTITITRKKIEHTGLRWEMLEGGIAHLKLSSFDEETENLLNQFIRQESDGIKGIVLDLRNNPGGFLDMAIEVSSEWVEHGIILRERDHAGEERQHHSRGRARLAGIPTVVLVNEGSASASEIVAGALQDYGVATIIGKTTFGKGSVQKYETLEDGSSFRLTVAKWFTPRERAIDEAGIVPDVEIDLTEEDFDNSQDPQLDAALQILRAAN